jgi:hypothetical protein
LTERGAGACQALVVGDAVERDVRLATRRIAVLEDGAETTVQ